MTDGFSFSIGRPGVEFVPGRIIIDVPDGEADMAIRMAQMYIEHREAERTRNVFAQPWDDLITGACGLAANRNAEQSIKAVSV